MIPLRIFLKGFLCYRDPQEFRFEGASLWILSGLNGSGKSTVFDALTYALFGQHRDGSQDALELIHKDAKGLAVEFDFDLDGTRYRARRTLRRGAGGRPSVSQQLRRYVPPAPGDDGPGPWEPVPDTTRKADFNAWVREHLGLSYETFASSVSNRYALSMGTHGNCCRRRTSSPLRRVSSFSASSSSGGDASHSSRVPIACVVIYLRSLVGWPSLARIPDVPVGCREREWPRDCKCRA